MKKNLFWEMLLKNNNDSNNNNNNNNDNNNNNIMIIISIIIKTITIISETLKYRVGVRRGIVYLMGRKNTSALGGSLSRDGVSIKRLVRGNHKRQSQIE